MSTTTKKKTITLNGEKWNVSDLAEFINLSEDQIKTLPPEPLVNLIDSKRKEQEAKQEAQEAKAKAERKSPAKRKTLAEKNRNKLRKFLQGSEPTESSLIMTEVILAPWKGAKELKQEIAPDHSRTFSTPVHDAKLMLQILMELELLDDKYVEEIKLEADKE